MESRTKAFTLIELLVVIAIIGILAGVVLVSLNSARVKARDARRMSDAKAIQTAMAMYFADNGDYPGAAPTGETAPEPDYRSLELYESSFVPQYMSALPVDPRYGRGANGYKFRGGSTSYILSLVMEGPNARCRTGVFADSTVFFGSGEAIRCPF